MPGYLIDGDYDGPGGRRSARRRSAAIASSLVCHVAVLAILQVPLVIEPPKHDPKVVETYLVHPDPPAFRQKTVREKPPPPIAVPVPHTKGNNAQPPVPSLPVDKSKVDPDRADIDIQYPTQHLADILEAFHGCLAFGDPKTPRYISSRFEPPTWTLIHQGSERRDRYVALEIVEHYPFLDELRRRYHLEGQAAYVLFDYSFSERLRDAVREQATTEGPVVMASIWLAVNPARIEVRSIEMGPGSRH